MSVYSCLKSEKPIVNSIFPERRETDLSDELPGNQNATSFFKTEKKMCWPIIDW